MATAEPIDLDELCPPGPVIVAAPHPDDESLGCGGLIAMAADQGRQVVVAVLTDGRASHPGSRAYPPERLAELRADEARAAVAELGTTVELQMFGAVDGRLEDACGDATTWLLALVRRTGARSVFTTWGADPHPDHKTAGRIAARVGIQASASVWLYPVWGLALPDDDPAGCALACRRLDIGRVLERKRRAILAHGSQTTSLIRDDPNGFQLSQADLARHLSRWETYLQLPAS